MSPLEQALATEQSAAAALATSAAASSLFLDD
jgi:hypothetical protein